MTKEEIDKIKTSLFRWVADFSNIIPQPAQDHFYEIMDTIIVEDCEFVTGPPQIKIVEKIVDRFQCRFCKSKNISKLEGATMLGDPPSLPYKCLDCKKAFGIIIA